MKKTKKNPEFTPESFGQFCHDLRTPLTIMKLHLDLLSMPGAKKMDEKKLRLFIKMMNKEIDRIIKML